MEGPRPSIIMAEEVGNFKTPTKLSEKKKPGKIDAKPFKIAFEMS